MSTRANIIIKDNGSTTQVYRHNDGYPGVTGEQLKDFCTSSNFDKFAILKKMSESISEYTKHSHYEVEYIDAICIHGDLEYVYIIDTAAKTLTAYALQPFGYIQNLDYIVKNAKEVINILPEAAETLDNESIRDYYKNPQKYEIPL